MSEDEKTAEKSQSEDAMQVAVAGKVAGGVMVKLFGPIAEEVGRDWAQWYRARKANLDTILPQFAQKVEAAGPERIQPPMSVVIPMIEKASLEDNAFMQEKWASLLASSVSPAKVGKMRKAFSQILSEMEPEEAKVLDFIYNMCWATRINCPNRVRYVYEIKISVDLLKGSVPMGWHALSSPILHNLIRMGLCQHPTGDANTDYNRSEILIGGKEGEGAYLTNADKYVCLSTLGADFVECCRA